jgi:hypothetical protein
MIVAQISHGSYYSAITTKAVKRLLPAFIRLANNNHILPFPLLPHLTHCMQPLHVGVFHPYKYWHDKAIKAALAKLEIDYTVCHFLKDLAGIRQRPLLLLQSRRSLACGQSTWKDALRISRHLPRQRLLRSLSSLAYPAHLVSPDMFNRLRTIGKTGSRIFSAVHRL